MNKKMLIWGIGGAAAVSVGVTVPVVLLVNKSDKSNKSESDGWVKPGLPFLTEVEHSAHLEKTAKQKDAEDKQKEVRQLYFEARTKSAMDIVIGRAVVANNLMDEANKEFKSLLDSKLESLYKISHPELDKIFASIDRKQTAEYVAKPMDFTTPTGIKVKFTKWVTQAPFTSIEWTVSIQMNEAAPELLSDTLTEFWTATAVAAEIVKNQQDITDFKKTHALPAMVNMNAVPENTANVDQKSIAAVQKIIVKNYENAINHTQIENAIAAMTAQNGLMEAANNAWTSGITASNPGTPTSTDTSTDTTTDTSTGTNTDTSTGTNTDTSTDAISEQNKQELATFKTSHPLPDMVDMNTDDEHASEEQKNIKKEQDDIANEYKTATNKLIITGAVTKMGTANQKMTEANKAWTVLQDTNAIKAITEDNEIAALFDAIDKRQLASDVATPQSSTTTTGVNVAFTTWTAQGTTITWTAHLTKGQGTPIDLTGTLSGFATEESLKTPLIESLTQDDILGLPTADPATLASTVKAVTGLTIKFHDDVTVAVADLTTNDNDGSLSFNVTFTKDGQTSDPVAIKITGYQMKITDDQVLACINADSSVDDAEATKLGIIITIAPNQQAFSLTPIGSTVDITYNVALIDSDVHNITVSPIVTKTLSGTTDPSAMAAEELKHAKAAIDTFKQDHPLPQALAANAAPGSETDEQKAAALKQAGIPQEYDDIAIASSSDDVVQKKAAITAAIAKMVEANKEMLAANAKYAQAAIDAVAIDAGKLAGLFTNMDKNQEASSVPQPSQFNEALNVLVEFTRWEAVGTTIHYKIHVSLDPGTAKDISGDITGFKTPLELEQDLLDSLTQADILGLPTPGNTIFASDNESLTLTVKSHADITVNVSNIVSDDEHGTLTCDVTFTNGEITSTTPITINLLGFKVTPVIPMTDEEILKLIKTDGTVKVDEAAALGIKITMVEGQKAMTALTLFEEIDMRYKVSVIDKNVKNIAASKEVAKHLTGTYMEPLADLSTLGHQQWADFGDVVPGTPGTMQGSMFYQSNKGNNYLVLSNAEQETYVFEHPSSIASQLYNYHGKIKLTWLMCATNGDQFVSEAPTAYHLINSMRGGGKTNPHGIVSTIQYLGVSLIVEMIGADGSTIRTEAIRILSAPHSGPAVMNTDGTVNKDEFVTWWDAPKGGLIYYEADNQLYDLSDRKPIQ